MKYPDHLSLAIPLWVGAVKAGI